MESGTMARMNQCAGKILLVGFLMGAFCGCGFASELGSTLPAPAAARPIAFSQVRLDGELGARYAAATCNLLTRTDRYSLDSFAASATGTPGALWWDWPGDQVGRWFSVLRVAQGYGWTLPADRFSTAMAGPKPASHPVAPRMDSPPSADRG
jgi:hypothetical protein